MRLENSLGNIEISADVIATIAGIAAVECYGLVGMASRKQLKDGIVELLGRESLSKGVEVSEVDGELCVDLYIIVGYGTRIDEVANNVISTVKYSVEKFTGLKVGHINVNVQGVRVINGK
ncbi:MAG: Asp23/Gls24 family envelope stress response protein [Firmicutes bacterium]|nr:Asp23/Gls24 family envelope stress response protein [Bacillota bacterium]